MPVNPRFWFFFTLEEGLNHGCLALTLSQEWDCEEVKGLV